MMQKAVQHIHKDASIWAALSLLCLFAIGTKSSISLDLILIALIGFYLSARFQIRGFCYAIALLFVGALARHVLLVHDHLFQLGLECSIGCTFFITALSFEEGSSVLDFLTSQLNTKEISLSHLEEDLAKVKQEAVNQQLMLQEKIALLQKDLEELQAEHSTILILNEVLRKTMAKHTKENADLTFSLRDAKEQANLLKIELEDCRKELCRLKDSDRLVIANRELVAELNQARVDKEQTHLINETLARLYLKEYYKAKDLEKEADSLSQELHIARKLMPKDEENQLLKQIENLKEELKKAEENKNAVKVIEQDPALLEQLNTAYAQINQLASVESKFRQLRVQFDEKNKVLHQVRSELFKADTELQRLALESIDKELSFETSGLEELYSELLQVEEENKELCEIIHVLSNSSELLEKRKKKVKIASSDNAQALLF
jgi:DNA repair exonuclease SbcCD ATPase subunit